MEICTYSKMHIFSRRSARSSKWWRSRGGLSELQPEIRNLSNNSFPPRNWNQSWLWNLMIEKVEFVWDFAQENLCWKPFIAKNEKEPIHSTKFVESRYLCQFKFEPGRLRPACGMKNGSENTSGNLTEKWKPKNFRKPAVVPFVTMKSQIQIARLRFCENVWSPNEDAFPISGPTLFALKYRLNCAVVEGTFELVKTWIFHFYIRNAPGFMAQFVEFEQQN